MEYRVLNNGTAVILTRQPQVVSDELYVSFSHAPDGATAIFTSGKDAFYRRLSGGCCSIPLQKMVGDVGVVVAQLDDVVHQPRWDCEGLIITRLQSGEYLVAPNDTNFPAEVVRLRLENEKLRDDLAVCRVRLSALEEKLQRIMDGYDIT